MGGNHHGSPSLMDPFWLLLIGILVVVGGILVLRLHPFLALLSAALIIAAATPAENLRQYAEAKDFTISETEKFISLPTGERVAREFGKTAGNIGILIAMAAVIGKCLLESGAADRIVRTALRLFGEPRAPFAFLGSGFLLGIPVFFDTVFYLLIPLGKALSLRTRRNYALYIMTIIAGGTMAHSLVPPTPGPLFVASELKVDLGLMILGGLVVGLFTSTVGYLYALWANQRWEIPLRDSAEFPLADLEKVSQKDARSLPPFFLAILPILLPVLLIAGNSIVQNFVAPASDRSHWQTQALTLLAALGNKNIALVIAAAISLWLLTWGRPNQWKNIGPAIQNALAGGGLIILITSAGGAFGSTLQHTGIGERIQELATTYQLALLPLAFAVTALVRTAQGSATVAMITTVGMLANLGDSGQLGFHPLYLALAIGCGSKPFPWMNDSGFWVISKMSGMTEIETIKTFSFMLTIMGLSGLLIIMLLAALFPLT
jgi:gluconate:H+ symporter, GntP family